MKLPETIFFILQRLLGHTMLRTNIFENFSFLPLVSIPKWLINLQLSKYFPMEICVQYQANLSNLTHCERINYQISENFTFSEISWFDTCQYFLYVLLILATLAVVGVRSL